MVRKKEQSRMTLEHSACSSTLMQQPPGHLLSHCHHPFPGATIHTVNCSLFRQASAIGPQERKSSFVGCTPESQGSPSQPSQTAFVSATSNHSLRLSGLTCIHSSWPRVLPSHCRRCVGSVQHLLTSPGHIPPVPGLMLLPWGFPVATKM